ncbi:MAG: YybH family protein [Longimicrobiales bacterium]
MKFRSLAGGTCCLLLFACGGGDQDANAGEPEEMVAVVDDETALTEMTDYYVTHFNLGHASMVTGNTYAEDALVLGANGNVLQGRDAITADMEANMAAGSPQVAVNSMGHVISGNNAVRRGTYTLTNEVDGEATSMSGAFINFATKTGDEWKVKVLQTNFEAGATADTWARTGGDPSAAEESMMTALIEGYETHYNLGHPSMVADLYTEDAEAAHNGPWLSGKAAITAQLEEQMAEGSPQLDIRGVTTELMGDGMALDRGWYEITVNGERAQFGTYTLLAQQDEAGDYKIKWAVSNGSPPAS